MRKRALLMVVLSLLMLGGCGFSAGGFGAKINKKSLSLETPLGAARLGPSDDEPSPEKTYVEAALHEASGLTQHPVGQGFLVAFTLGVFLCFLIWFFKKFYGECLAVFVLFLSLGIVIIAAEYMRGSTIIYEAIIYVTQAPLEAYFGNLDGSLRQKTEWVVSTLFGALLALDLLAIAALWRHKHKRKKHVPPEGRVSCYQPTPTVAPPCVIVVPVYHPYLGQGFLGQQPPVIPLPSLEMGRPGG